MIYNERVWKILNIFAIFKTLHPWAQDAISKVKKLAILRFQIQMTTEPRQVWKPSEGDRVGPEDDAPHLKMVAATFLLANSCPVGWLARLLDLLGFSKN